MSENVQKGENIVLAADNNIIIEQSTDFAKEKEQEQPVEEAKTEETPVSELITPDTVVSEIKVEEPSVGDVASVPEVPEIAVEAPKIDLDGLNLDAFNQSVAPEVSPSIDINPTADFGFGSVEPTQTPSYEAPTMDNNVGMFGGVAPEQTENYDAPISYQAPETSQTSNVSLFDDTYGNDDNVKVTATVVTEQDEINAKKANMEAYERLYDAGPGNQISILRKFSEESAKWMRIVDKSGFVSGEMHDMAKRILREYEGLGVEQDFADDNKVVKFPEQKDQYGSFGGFNNENIIPFNQNVYDGEDNSRERVA